VKGSRFVRKGDEIFLKVTFRKAVKEKKPENVEYWHK